MQIIEKTDANLEILKRHKFYRYNNTTDYNLFVLCKSVWHKIGKIVLLTKISYTFYFFC
jgi:hypothetical protein